MEGEEEEVGVEQEQQQQNKRKAVDHLGEDAQHYNAVINRVNPSDNIFGRFDVLFGPS